MSSVASAYKSMLQKGGQLGELTQKGPRILMTEGAAAK